MERVGDLPEQPFGLGPVVAFAAALEADQDVHDPAGVDDVVRRVENAALLEAPGVGRVFQLIIGAARDRATAQLGDRLAVEHAAQRARREDVALYLQDFVGLDPPGLELAPRQHGPLGIRIGQDDRSEEHTSELQSRLHLVCRLLLEKKKRQLDCSNTPMNSIEYYAAYACYIL